MLELVLPKVATPPVNTANVCPISETPLASRAGETDANSCIVSSLDTRLFCASSRFRMKYGSKASSTKRGHSRVRTALQAETQASSTRCLELVARHLNELQRVGSGCDHTILAITRCVARTACAEAVAARSRVLDISEEHSTTCENTGAFKERLRRNEGQSEQTEHSERKTTHHREPCWS